MNRKSKIARPNTELNNAWMDMEMADTMEELIAARDSAMTAISKWPEREWKVIAHKTAATIDCFEFVAEHIHTANS